VVRLYPIAFKDIGINRALRQERNPLQLACLFVKYFDKFAADDFAFSFGFFYAI